MAPALPSDDSAPKDRQRTHPSPRMSARHKDSSSHTALDGYRIGPSAEPHQPPYGAVDDELSTPPASIDSLSRLAAIGNSTASIEIASRQTEPSTSAARARLTNEVESRSRQGALSVQSKRFTIASILGPQNDDGGAATKSDIKLEVTEVLPQPPPERPPGPKPEQYVPVPGESRRRRAQEQIHRDRNPKSSRHAARQFENSWRMGSAPMALVKLSQEELNYNKVLDAINQYYQGNADGAWRDAILHENAVIDGKSAIEGFFVSITMAGSLIAARRQEEANAILSKNWPLTKSILDLQHPQTFFFLMEMALDTSPTPMGVLQREMKVRIGNLAVEVFGPSHPVSVLLTTPLTHTQSARLRVEGQRKVSAELVRAFGQHSYQVFLHSWYFTRIVKFSGSRDTALDMITGLVGLWEKRYGANSALAVMGLIEFARALFTMEGASIRVECIICDALRRIDILARGGPALPPPRDAAEARLRMSGLVFAHISALRVLARVHVKRNNFASARYYLEQALGLAEGRVAPDSPTIYLTATDLAAVKMMELEAAMGALAVGDPTERMPSARGILPLTEI